jgi:hypothetical protein
MGLMKHKLNFIISLTVHFHDLHHPQFVLSHSNSWGFDVKYSDRQWPTIQVHFLLFWYTLHTVHWHVLFHSGTLCILFTGMFYGIGSVGPLPLRKVMSLLRCSPMSIHIRAPPPTLSIWSCNNIRLIQDYLFTDSKQGSCLGGKILHCWEFVLRKMKYFVLNFE